MFHPDDSVPNVALCWNMIRDVNFFNACAIITFALFVWLMQYLTLEQPVEMAGIMVFVKLQKSKGLDEGYYL